MNLFRKYLLTSVCFAPRTEGDPPTRQRVAEAVQDDDQPEADIDDGLVDDDIDAAEAADDDAQVDDEFSDDLEPEPEPEPRQRGRAQGRIERLANDNRALKDEIAASQARLAALETRMAQPAPRQEDQRELEARYALMSPEERMSDRLERSLNQQSQQTSAVLAEIQDTTDATAFRALIREKPQYAKYATTVETRLKSLKVKGTPLPREAVLMFLVGEAAVKDGGKPQKKTNSARRMQEQDVRPSAGRGDVRGGDRRANSGSAMSAVERRLQNTRI